MGPIFGVLVLTFILIFDEIETADRFTKMVSDKLKKLKTSKPSSVKEGEDEPDVSKMVKRLKNTKSSSLTEEEKTVDTYGTSRATRRKLVPKPKSEQKPRLQLEPSSKPKTDNRKALAMFEHRIDASGEKAFREFLDHYSKVRPPSPEVGGDTYALYENTVSHVPGGIYQDHEGNYYQRPQYPPPSTEYYDFNQLHQSGGMIPPSGPSSYLPSTPNYGYGHFYPSGDVIPPSGPYFVPPSTQTHGHNQLLQSHGAIYPSGPSSQHQRFQNHQLQMNDPSDLQGIDFHNDYLRYQYPHQSGGSGSGHGSSHPYQM